MALFDSQKHVNVNVYFYIDGSWVDITSRVMTRDGSNKLTITRGRANEQTVMPPSKLSFLLNNRDGLFSNRNPNSPYFGLLGRNVPVAVWLGGGMFERFYGEVTALPQRWDITGNDVWVPVEASGIKQRLTQGTQRKYYALESSILAESPLAYWPMNDGANATFISSGLKNGSPMEFNGTEIVMDSIDPPAGTSGKYMEMVGTGDPTSFVAGRIDRTATKTVIEGWVRFTPSNPASNAHGNAFGWWTTGTYCQMYVQPLYFATPGMSVLNLVLDTGVASGSPTTYSIEVGDGNWHQIVITLEQVGGNISVTTSVDNHTATDTFAGTIGTISTIEAPWVHEDVVNDFVNVGSISTGNIAVYATDKSSTGYAAGNAYVGETAGRRIERLCAESGIGFTAVGDLDASQALGPQPFDTRVNIMQNAADADLGYLYETRNALGLTYRPRNDIYNQTGTTFDYATGVVSPPLEPIDDDPGLLNDITATRDGGGNARYEKTSGANNVNEPTDDPQGVGRYPADAKPNFYTDEPLADYCGWRVHMGTWDESRYPTINFALHREMIRTNDVLLAALLDLDISKTFSLSNLPAWMPPEDVQQFVEGYSEQIGNFTIDLSYNCTPGARWNVGVYGTARYSSEDSTLHTGINTTALSMQVDFLTTRWVRAADDAGSLPFNIKMAGEEIQVTAVTGTTSPQTFTIVRSINGVVKSHVAGEPIELATPARYAL